MPRKNLIRTIQFPYHVTIRSNNREWFDLEMIKVWMICENALAEASLRCSVKVEAFVLMSNHYHLMLWTPEANIDRFMYVLNSFISKRIREETGRINRIFGDRYKWSVIDSETYYLQALKYIYQNPVKASLSKLCEEYQFSTLHHCINQKKLKFKVFRPIYREKDELLSWINQQYTDEENLAIKKAITKPIYKLPVVRTSRRST